MTPPPPPLRIRFDQHTLDIVPPDPAVRAGLEREFRFMLASDPADPLAPLTPGVASGDLDETLLTLRYAIIRRFMDARDDLVWFHGSAVARGGRAVLFPGARGRGKSTMVAALCAAGWSFVSDDALPVDPRSLLVAPFPQAPAFREYPGRAMPPDWLLTAPKRTATIPAHQVARRPAAIAAIVFPRATPQRPMTLEPRGPAAAALDLLAGCWDVPRNRERAMDAVAAITRATPAWDLTFSDADSAAGRVADLA